MNQPTPTPEQWLASEDQDCRGPRAERLAWLLSVTPTRPIWMFPGGWLGKQLFEEARYSFVYGQFIAAAILGFAFVERTLAAMFYGAGRDDLERATGEKLFKEALKVGWLNGEEISTFEHARRLRNPLAHFRRPMQEEGLEWRSVHREMEPYEVLQDDAQRILEVMFRLVHKNAAG